jgi:hypothetical protein
LNYFAIQKPGLLHLLSNTQADLTALTVEQQISVLSFALPHQKPCQQYNPTKYFLATG